MSDNGREGRRGTPRGSDVSLHVVLSAEEAAELRAVAEEEQMPVGDYMRYVLVTQMRERRIYREWKAKLVKPRREWVDY